MWAADEGKGRGMGEFADAVYAAVRQVPRGMVASYGQIAAMVGRPRSARYVGFALHVNPHPGAGPDAVPCHRVVYKDGSLCSGFAFGGVGEQLRLLLAEGVRFVEAPSEAEDARAGELVVADLGDGRGERELLVGSLRVDMGACQWPGPGEDDGKSVR